MLGKLVSLPTCVYLIDLPHDALMTQVAVKNALFQQRLANR